MKKLFLFLFIGLASYSGYAQDAQLSTKNKKAAKYYQEAAMRYDERQNDNAVMLLKKALGEDSSFIEAQTMLGYVYEDMGNYEDAEIQYRRALNINPAFYSKIYFDLARLEMRREDYTDAKKHIETFLATRKGNADIVDQANHILDNCNFAIPAIQHPVPFNPANMGAEVNSRFDDYFPTMTVDGSMLLFTRNLNMSDPNNPGFSDYQEDFYVCYKQDGQWMKAVNVGPPLNTSYNEGAPTLSADGNMLIFTGCDRPEGHGSCDLYYAFWVGNNWSRARNLGSPVNTPNWETQPCISSDGKSLYFIRGLESGHSIKSEDIYVTTLSDSGSWAAPVRLSDTINTPGKEECPFISADNNTLYFCSDGHPGFGGTDIYMSRRLPNGRWGIPKNLGYPINTSKDETGLMIDPNGSTAYFSSNRPGGLGGMDIYSFTLYDSIKPEPVTYFKGKIFNAVTKAPIIAAFDLIDLKTGNVVTHSTSKPGDGTFILCLPVNKNYALNVHKKGFLFYSDNFSLTPENGNATYSYDHPYLKDIPLQPIDTGVHIVLNNIFFETNKYDLKPESEIELNKLVLFLKNNPTLKIEISGHTDNQGTPQSNITLSENRAKSVYNYLTTHSIEATRLTYKGYGQTMPVATNDTPEGRAKNRRTEMKITGK